MASKAKTDDDAEEATTDDEPKGKAPETCVWCGKEPDGDVCVHCGHDPRG